MNFFNVQGKKNEINEQGKEKNPVNEMDEINEQGNEHVIIQRQLIRIHKFI
jgi:hypothetical protein